MTFICEFCGRGIEDESDIRAAGPTTDEGYACKECFDRGVRKPHDGYIWSSQQLPGETMVRAAARFVRETFGVERKIVWVDLGGLFHFADGYWVYRIAPYKDQWRVGRTSDKTPRALARSSSRRTPL